MRLISDLKKYLGKYECIIHETKRKVLLRFLGVLFILIAYLIFVSMRYGMENGILITFLTWSFFVFCKPIADAGFLLDFPIRLITKIKMIYSEIFVWFIAFLINFYALVFRPEVYEQIELLKIFKHIILNPIPYWSIIIVSAIGTFLSIYFGDELMSVVKHKHRKGYKKHKNKHIVILVIFLVLTIILYSHLLKGGGLNLSLF